MGQEINQLVEAMNAHDLDAVVQLFRSKHSARGLICAWSAR